MQLDLFITAPSSAPALIGLTVKLERPGDHCCDDRVVIGSSKGPHAASLHCAGCGRHRGWLPAAALGFIEETRQRFGATEIITFRNSQFRSPPGAGDEINEARR